MKNLAIFASGSGSNAENIINFFKDNNEVNIKLILCNNPSAFVIERAKRLNTPCKIFDKKDMKDGNIFTILKENSIDYIILAGFLWLVPKEITSYYDKKIINIHPALLPNYGGKGMYGDKVHKSVYENKEDKSGITIHFVNEFFDNGDIIFQAETKLTREDTPDTIAKKVHELEYEYFPKIISKTISL
ncbi:MAG: phosphoribosylglycinamide formyltransferase [Bacteroidetes bacterium]|nr:phosphoribosylglycinamide formyltransferase [Bacteroidota bacterium]